jgi:hypothetical protein
MKKFLSVVALMLFASCKPSPTIAVPVGSCTSQYTGQTRDASYFYYTCVSFDKNGFCTVNVPVNVPQTSREVAVKCEFTEWRVSS